MLIWVASYPRSGNNLLRTALRTGWGIAGPPVRAPERRGGKRRWWQRGGERLIEDPRIAEFRGGDRPRVLKTHLLRYAASPDPALYLVRDGRDAVLSYSYFVHERPELARGRGREEILLRLIERFGDQYGGWSESIAAWSGRRAPTAVVRFERLREDPHGVAATALAELGLEVGEPRGEMESFERMRERSPDVVRRGQVGDWRREMSAEAIERFADLHGETLVRLGYERSADPAEWSPAPAG